MQIIQTGVQAWFPKLQVRVPGVRNVHFPGRRFWKAFQAYQTRGGIAAWDCSARAVISTDTIDHATTNMDFSADILARAMFFVRNETFYVAPPPTTTTEKTTVTTYNTGSTAPPSRTTTEKTTATSIDTGSTAPPSRTTTEKTTATSVRTGSTQMTTVRSTTQM